MLKPAILYKDEIFAKLLEYSYTDDMLFYMGCLDNELPKIEENSSGNVYQYAIIGKDNKLIGYLHIALIGIPLVFITLDCSLLIGIIPRLDLMFIRN